MLYCTVHALGEMAVLFPIAGAFSVYSSRFIDPAWGFAMGWKSVAPKPEGLKIVANASVPATLSIG